MEHVSRDDTGKENHILLFTILNPAYPITVDVLHTICTPSGQVQRIVIFKKNGVQAMVEFDNVDSAKKAKESLHGCDIYSGCCTLKVEYAKPAKLNVYKNDAESWDYSNPNMGKPAVEQGSSRPVLLQEPPRYSGHSAYKSYQNYADYWGYKPTGDTMRGYGMSGDRRYEDGGYGMHQNGPGHYGASADMYGESMNTGDSYGMRGDYSAIGRPSPTRAGYGLMPAPTGQSTVPQQGAVMMVYGLSQDKVNSDKLFNLFCLYGNVVRIKFLKTKEGCAMIQMGDALSVERCVQHLSNTTFFDSKMQLGYSKQAFLSDVQQPYELVDGTPSFRDYMGNKNNRFINPEMASKNRIQPPSKILHFFNTPPDLEESVLQQVFIDSGITPPKTVKMLPTKTERSSSGLLEFKNISEAIEALIMNNHTPIPYHTGKFPYIMKLCFSSSRNLPN